MATTPNESHENTEYDVLQRSLTDLQSKLTAYIADQHDIDSRLNSWSLSLWQQLGMVGVEVNEKNVLTLDNASLNKEQLQQKRSALDTQIQEYNRIIAGVVQEISKMDQVTKDTRRLAAAESFKAKQQQLEAKFLANPDAFYAAVLPHMPINQEKTSVVYDNARDIIAACEAFPSETNRYKLVEAWSVVAQARDRAFTAYQAAVQDRNVDPAAIAKLNAENDEFFNGAKRVFQVFVDKGPSGLQGAKFLYDQRMYEQAEYYLNRAVIDQKLIDRLTGEVTAICSKQAQAILASIPNFQQLPINVREALISQQTFIQQLSFDLESVPDAMREAEYAQLQQGREALRDNITNVIANYGTEQDVNAEYARLKAGLEQTAVDVRRHWYQKQFEKNLKVSLGAGLGIAWLFGAGVPVGAAIGFATSTIISNIDVAEGNINIPSIAADTVLLNEVGVVDYNFIKDAEKKWHDGSPAVQQIPAEVNSVSDQARQKFADKKEELQSQIKNAGDQYWQEHMDPVIQTANAKAVRLYLGIIVMSVIILTVLAVALPVAWPVYVAVAGCALLGLGYLYAKKAANPSAPAATEIGPLIDATYNAVQRTKSGIRRAVNFALVQPVRAMGRAFMALFTPSTTTKLMRFVKADNNFNIEQISQKISPERAAIFVNFLEKHFEKRATLLLQERNEIQSLPRSAYTEAAEAAINTKVNLLENARQQLEAAAATNNPHTFLNALNDYLDSTFKLLENEYLQDAKVRKQEGYDLSKEKQNMLFRTVGDGAPEVLAEQGIDYAQKQKGIIQVLELQEEFRKFKQDF